MNYDHTNPEHGNNIAGRLNWLRAAVLGSNDGIISLAALMVGIAGATNSAATLLLTGISGLFAGAFSMAAGEYVSVSSQRDAEKVHNIEELTSAWHAAMASAISFTAGALIPLLATVLTPEQFRLPVTVVAALLALILTGILSSNITGAHPARVTIRVLIGGTLAMAVTFGIGTLFHGIV
ncbi:MAG: hypothetical protein JWL75_158 [Parcubacteria group bacterium]|nr:hypothetical protein [Parcubacteria group bacterium]